MKSQDYPQRQLALDPTQSFIVEAPAGSGKTSLLIQRYLTLLAGAAYPEEILAITFTRKAANELQDRIFQALALAKDQAPDDEHKLHIWQLASRVLVRDAASHWQLLNNPNRLRITTIDAFCAGITQKNEEYPNSIVTSEESRACYRQAVEDLLTDFADEQALDDLLLHLDNNWPKFAELLIKMLGCRDQWLPYIAAYNDPVELRMILEQSLVNLVKENLADCKTNFPANLYADLSIILDFIQPEIKTLPEIAQWLKIIELLLTEEHEWRKTVTAKQGFPSEKSAANQTAKQLQRSRKQQMLELLAKLKDHEELRESLQSLALSPQPFFSEAKWSTLIHLITILKSLAAYYLPQVFNRLQKIDHIEIALKADRILGNELNPTDLVLQLDYQIKHILVDEFQDTSIMQYRLLEKLTASWVFNDGRTLFLIGDPMQSIYKFRNAQVGLFLRAKKYGLNAIKLTTITLQSNFRARSSLVTWTNDHLAQIFPKIEKIGVGAVKFIQSQAEIIDDTPSVHLHALASEDDEAEAQQLVKIVQHHQAIAPGETMAILVRNRSHLTKIIPVLQSAQVVYSALDLETLAENSLIQDLYSLTRALLNLADRLAWLAILRAPWCGLNLYDLHAVASAAEDQPIWMVLQNYQIIPNLSVEAKQRLTKLVAVLMEGFNNLYRQSLRKVVETIWLAVDGDESKIKIAEAYFDLLAKLERAGDLDDQILLEKMLASLYLKPMVSDSLSLQIMTIHRAKGLEFDTVIIPGLHRVPKQTERPLLLWAERPSAFSEQDGDLILAPIKNSYEKADAIFEYLFFEDQKQQAHETSRLLYVAVTRAKRNLYLLAALPKKGEIPHPKSFLKRIYSEFQGEI